VQLYAGAFFPGVMLAGLYILYVIVLAKLRPHLMPPLPESERHVPLAPAAEAIATRVSTRVLPGLLGAMKGSRNAGVPFGEVARQALLAALPALFVAVMLGGTWRAATAPVPVEDTAGLVEMGAGGSGESSVGGGLAEPPGSESSSDSGGLAEPPSEDAPKEASAGSSQPSAAQGVQEPAGAAPPPPTTGAAQGVAEPPVAKAADAAAAERRPTPTWWWILAGVLTAVVVAYYAVLTFARLEIFKMLLASFFPLAFLILMVLGTIVFGLATPTEAAAVGSFGGLLLAAAYRQLNLTVLRESVFLTAKTSAMV
jgi:TRAP-type mannitol/chloroaromatic compound transport system permease large subunit